MGYWRVGLRLVDPTARREQWCDEKKQKPRISEIKRLDSQAYKLENGLLKLVERLERKRDRGEWIDSLIVKESNAAYGDD
jgi:hypothetical protein